MHGARWAYNPVRAVAIGRRVGAAAMAVVLTAALVIGNRAVADDLVRVTWSAAGLPPTYVAQTRTADVSPELRAEFDKLLASAKFFELPADLGIAPLARDAGTYQITVEVGSQRHSVRFSDTSVTPGLAALRSWIRDKLSPSARSP